MAFVKMKPPAGVTVGLGADGKQYYVNDRGFANVDSGSVTKLTNEGWSSVTDVAPGTPLEDVKSRVDPVTGGVEVPFVVKGKSAAALAAAPSAADIALGDSTLFYDIADPTKRYALSSARTSFVLVTDGKVRPYILSQSGAPVILMSSGAVNASGQFTLMTALPYIPAGNVKVYVFAGVGLAAGLYSATFSSTTVCQLIGNPATTAGAYSGGTTEVTLGSVSVPGGAMGPNGALRGAIDYEVANNANMKTIKAKVSTAVPLNHQPTSAVGGSYRGTFSYRNINSQASGKYFQSWINGTVEQAGGSVQVPSTIDTSQNQSLAFTGQLSVATDYIIIDGYTIEVIPGV